MIKKGNSIFHKIRNTMNVSKIKIKNEIRKLVDNQGESLINHLINDLSTNESSSFVNEFSSNLFMEISNRACQEELEWLSFFGVETLLKEHFRL